MIARCAPEAKARRRGNQLADMLTCIKMEQAEHLLGYSIPLFQRGHGALGYSDAWLNSHSNKIVSSHVLTSPVGLNNVIHQQTRRRGTNAGTSGAAEGPGTMVQFTQGENAACGRILLCPNNARRLERESAGHPGRSPIRGLECAGLLSQGRRCW